MTTQEFLDDKKEIIQKQNALHPYEKDIRALKQTIPQLKKAAFALGAISILLLVFAIYSTSKLQSIERDLDNEVSQPSATLFNIEGRLRIERNDAKSMATASYVILACGVIVLIIILAIRSKARDVLGERELKYAELEKAFLSAIAAFVEKHKKNPV